jgi:hypothetical protein
MWAAVHDSFAGILLRAEISFLIAFIVLIGFCVTPIPFVQLQASMPADARNEGTGYLPQDCPPGVQLPAGSSSIVDRSSFTALDWPSTVVSHMPSFQPNGVHYSGPSALLDDHTIASCFSFVGSQGGAFLVSRSTKHHISQFTLNNLAVDLMVGSAYYPKEGALWGLFEGSLPEELKNATTSFVTEYATYVLIGNFCFDPERGSIQTFVIEENVAALSAVKFSVFYIEVLSNWGGSHTCICRLQLHGNQ